MNSPAPESHFLPPSLDPSDFAQLEPLLQDLLDRDLSDADALDRWLTDLSELHKAVDEYGSRRHIATSCRTDDEAAERDWLHVVNVIQPQFQKWHFRLQQKFAACPPTSGLDPHRWGLMIRQWKTDVDIYREPNIALKAELRNLDNQYGKICGEMNVAFQGKTRTLQQMKLFLEETDRPTREQAWTAVADRRLQDREKLDDLFDEMLGRRQQLAVNADLDNFRDYIWQSRHRYYYSPDDCLSFGRAVERVCMPIIEQMDAKRREALGVEQLRPWDGEVDPQGRAPLRPFDPDNIEDLLAKTRDMFEQVHPQLSQWFASMKPGDHLDLATRPHKRPGGFQCSLEQVQQPFIFMNAAGTHDDLVVLLHEAGHAFHFLAATVDPCVFTRHAPMEFCEVASMSMELIGTDFYDVFYPDADEARRARRCQLERVIRLLPWVATIDGFQHWLYTHPDHSPAERTDAWLDLRRRFGSPAVDWSGLDAALQAMWQRQLHLYGAPFYYIEYGIAQLGALGVWNNYRRDRARALSRLIASFEAGGKQSLPELFATAGLTFDFSEKTIRPLVEMVWKEWNELED